MALSSGQFPKDQQVVKVLDVIKPRGAADTVRRSITGFTIIEVVLVLAIAGLIFLIVFLAVPQLQRSRRDTQRRSDLGRLGSLLESVASNSTGNYPTDAAGVTTAINFANSNLKNPSDGNAYAVTDTAGSIATGTIYYDQGGSCSTSGTVTAGTGTRKYAVGISLENGGSTCVSSS